MHTEKIKAFLELVKERYGDVSAKEGAAFFQLSPRQYRKIIRFFTGKNHRQLCLEARYAPARREVLRTDKPIVVIAQLSGYKRSKFDKSYTSAFGLTPAQDRNRGHSGGQTESPVV